MTMFHLQRSYGIKWGRKLITNLSAKGFGRSRLQPIWRYYNSIHLKKLRKMTKTSAKTDTQKSSWDLNRVPLLLQHYWSVTIIIKLILTLCQAQWSHLQLCKPAVHVALLSVGRLHTPELLVLALVCTTVKKYFHESADILSKQSMRLAMQFIRSSRVSYCISRSLFSGTQMW
jgi:hypothetical protein